MGSKECTIIIPSSLRVLMCRRKKCNEKCKLWKVSSTKIFYSITHLLIPVRLIVKYTKKVNLLSFFKEFVTLRTALFLFWKIHEKMQGRMIIVWHEHKIESFCTASHIAMNGVLTLNIRRVHCVVSFCARITLRWIKSLFQRFTY